jgi:hypothetical protein
VDYLLNNFSSIIFPIEKVEKLVEEMEIVEVSMRKWHFAVEKTSNTRREEIKSYEWKEGNKTSR